MPQVTFDDVLAAIEHLPLDEQADLLDVVRKRLADHGRQRVVEEVRQAQAEFAQGHAKPASTEDIMREIQS